MFIRYCGVEYPCRCVPAKDMNYHNLPDVFPVPVTGEIALCADDGFTIRTDVVEDYVRQIFANGTLTLTNTPEPELEEETEDAEYVPTPLEQLRADVDYIAMEMGVEL